MTTLKLIGALALVLAVAACKTAGTDIHDLATRGEPSHLHTHAPQWFKDYWKQYETTLDNRSLGRYGILALDRNGNGASYTYCSGKCQVIAGNESSWKSFYSAKAGEDCRKTVRRDYPAHRPDCDIYAVGKQIVWKGLFPWGVEDVEDVDSSASRAPELSSKRAAASLMDVGPGRELPSRSIAVTWEGIPGVFTGTVRSWQGDGFVRTRATARENDVTCEGRYWRETAFIGRWTFDCGYGVSAEGRYNGLRGEGRDNLGRKVQYILGTAGGGS